MCSSFQQLISRRQCAKRKGNKIFRFRGLKIAFKFLPLLVNNFSKIKWGGILRNQKYFILDWFCWGFLLLFYLLKIYVSDHSLESQISGYIKYFQWTEKCTSLSYFCVWFTHHQNTSSVTLSSYRGAAQLNPKPLSPPAALWSQRKRQRDFLGAWEGNVWDSRGERFWKRRVGKSRTGEGVSPGGNEEHPAAPTDSLRQVLPTGPNKLETIGTAPFNTLEESLGQSRWEMEKSLLNLPQRS